MEELVTVDDYERKTNERIPMAKRRANVLESNKPQPTIAETGNRVEAEIARRARGRISCFR